MKGYGIFLILSLLVACQSKEQASSDRIPVLEVEGKFLYLDQIENIIPPNLSAEDSLEIVKSYIRKWATDILMYENAKRNVSDPKEIDQLIEDYRKSLTIHQYQQKLIQQRLPQEPTDSDMIRFYEEYQDQFILNESIIQGLLLVVPQGAPNLANVRKWVQSGNTKSLEQIEKYSIQNALSYDYFGNKWVPITDILKKIPMQVESPSDFVGKYKFYETKDSLKIYFLNIQKYRKFGEKEPFDRAKDRISNLILNKMKSDFITDFEKELYEDAVTDGNITFFNENN